MENCFLVVFPRFSSEKRFCLHFMVTMEKGGKTGDSRGGKLFDFRLKPDDVMLMGKVVVDNLMMLEKYSRNFKI